MPPQKTNKQKNMIMTPHICLLHFFPIITMGFKNQNTGAHFILTNTKIFFMIVFICKY